MAVRNLVLVMLVMLLSIATAGSVADLPQDQGERTIPRGRESGVRERPELPPGVDALVQMQIVGQGAPQVGDAVVLRVELTARGDVGHVPFQVRFDPAVLRFDAAEEGPFLRSDGTSTAFLASVSAAGDTLVVGASRLGRRTGAAGHGRLCTLRFTAIGAGQAGLDFAGASVRDGQNRPVPAEFRAARLRVR